LPVGYANGGRLLEPSGRAEDGFDRRFARSPRSWNSSCGVPMAKLSRHSSVPTKLKQATMLQEVFEIRHMAFGDFVIS
jgi:hypothetical protein